MRSRTCPSVKTLMKIKGVTRGDAEEIRAIWKAVESRRWEARDKIDVILHTYGVEYLGWHKRQRQHAYYCNAGDSYAITVVFVGLSMRVACWADYIERNLIEGN